MDTLTLRTFLTLASLNNFTQTAQVMFIAQSTVTNRIADLERETGKKLFLRDKKNVTLTKEGALFLSYAKRIVDLEEQSMKELNSFCYTNTLRIGTTNTVYECHLYPVIRQFMKLNPDTAVKVTLGHSNDLLHMLQDGIIDIVYTYLPFNRSGFICNSRYHDDLVLVTSASDTVYKDGIYQEQLSELKYLMCNFALEEVGIFIRSLFPDYYQFSFEIDNSTKLIHYLKDGAGYSFLPLSLVKTELASGTLRSIPLLDFTAPRITTYCVFRQENLLCRKFQNKGGNYDL